MDHLIEHKRFWEKPHCFAFVYDNDSEFPIIMATKLRSYILLEVPPEILKEIEKRAIAAGVEIFLSMTAYKEKYPSISAAERMKIDHSDCD